MPQDVAPFLLVSFCLEPRPKVLFEYVFLGFHGHATTVTELVSTREGFGNLFYYLQRIITLKPRKRLLPVGFQTDYKTKIKKDVEDIDIKIDSLKQDQDFRNPFLISLATANEIVDLISKTLMFDGKDWDPKSHKACLEHLSKNTKNTSQVGNVWCLVRKDRSISRFKQDGSFSDGPYGTKTEGAIAAKVAIDIPMLMLFRQNGHKTDGWKDQPFWWPVITAPENTHTSIFADTK